mmetsp:Transcript_6862/g.7893  ORF Transcript_6862/g.7893 Transcript_6862/m.7893 type:complete len:293 (+) Transcript_6862:138-1016(+)
MSRPEHTASAEIFYNQAEARKYARSTRMQQIQSVISERAIELLNLPEDSGPALLLDIGCGCGMSGDVVEKQGHTWIGMDISKDMLEVAQEGIVSEEESNGDVILSDMGQGVGFRGGSFDGAISISAVQWLCYASKKSYIPRLRLKRFFQQLYGCLKRGSRAVIQLYPETPQQMEMISHAAMAVGFTGGLVVDYPNSAKAKKFYLCLFAGQPVDSAPQKMPKGLGDPQANQQEIQYEDTRRSFGKNKKRHRRDGKGRPTLKEWVMAKKQRQRRQGKNVRPDSKYTGRKRRGHF